MGGIVSGQVVKTILCAADENTDELRGCLTTSSRSLIVSPAQWHYLGGELVTPGGASAQATLPAGTTIFEVAPEGEGMYYSINTVAANANSPGYVADGSRELVGPLDNLNSLAVYMIGANTIHIQYFRET